MDKKKILVADDEQSIRALVKRLLSDQYTVLEAGDGESAVSMAQAHRPDLVLMDIMMPKMDGYTACYAIKSDPVTRMIPVVMLTALDSELNRRLGEEVWGDDGYVTKPFSLQDLKHAISRFL